MIQNCLCVGILTNEPEQEKDHECEGEHNCEDGEKVGRLTRKTSFFRSRSFLTEYKLKCHKNML